MTFGTTLVVYIENPRIKYKVIAIENSLIRSQVDIRFVPECFIERLHIQNKIIFCLTVKVYHPSDLSRQSYILSPVNL
jgi:hypothetical protein